MEFSIPTMTFSDLLVSIFQRMHIYLPICALVVFASLVRLFKLPRVSWARSTERTGSHCNHQHGVTIYKTQIIPCKLSHHRRFPRQHGFIYDYLAVGIPVRNPKSNWMLSVDASSWWSRGLLHVTAMDHLHRALARSDRTLSKCLDAFLIERVR